MPLTLPPTTAAVSKWSSYWKPSAALVENFPFGRAYTTAAESPLLTTGRLFLTGGLVLTAGTTYTSISFASSTTALSGGSNQVFCLIDTAGNVLRKTADDTSTAWAASKIKTLTLSSTYTPTTEIAVYAGIWVVATAIPTLSGITLHADLAIQAPPLAVIPGQSFTNPASMGSTITGLTAANGDTRYVWAAVN